MADFPEDYETRKKAFLRALIQFELDYPGVCLKENYRLYLVKGSEDGNNSKDLGGIVRRTLREGTGDCRGEFHFYPRNYQNEELISDALRHELLGHHGINTFVSAEKYEFIKALTTTRHNPEFAQFWQEIDALYLSDSEFQKAEEVFAFV